MEWIYPPIWVLFAYLLGWLILPGVTLPRVRHAWRRWRRARPVKRAWILATLGNDLAMPAALAVAYARHQPPWIAGVIIIVWLILHGLLTEAAHPYIYRARRLRRAWNRAPLITGETT